MLRIRLFEEFLAALLRKGKIRCPTHLSIGQEGIAAGVCAALEREDLVWSMHRNHGHLIAKGGNFAGMIAEILGKTAGLSHGYGGSMHLRDPKIGFMGSTAIVAANIPLGVGGGLALKTLRRRNVSVTFFGDGGTDEGVFYESLNLAALYGLPVLFVCENNLYSTHRRVHQRHAQLDICTKASAMGLKTVRVDGNDAQAVYAAAKQARAQILKEKRPFFIEAMTYRWLAHVGPEEDLDFDFRTRAEVESWIRRCPITSLEKVILSRKLAEQAQLDRLRASISNEVQKAYRKYSR
jgi:pyruvate dehydrogenase E1 component alpha subunit